MDKIKKLLKKLASKERSAIKHLLGRLKKGQLQGLDIQKLKNRKDIFRIRKGNLRIIYRQTKDKISILAVERRSEKTYKNS